MQPHRTRRVASGAARCAFVLTPLALLMTGCTYFSPEVGPLREPRDPTESDGGASEDGEVYPGPIGPYETVIDAGGAGEADGP